MPTGDIAVRVGLWLPTKTVFAQPSRREDTSSPVCGFPCLDFDQTTSEYMDVLARFESARSYSGGSIRVYIDWITSATSGSTTFRVGFRRLAVGEVLSASHTFSFKTVTLTAGTANAVIENTIDFAASEIDGCVAGDLALIRLGRDTSGNTLAADVRMIQSLLIKEL